MKNETDNNKSKSSKISALKKKLVSSTNETTDEEKKSKKGKKLKKGSEENAKLSKGSSFVRKFNFSKYMAAQTDLTRATSSKSVSESDNSDRVSSGYSTLTPTSLKRQEVEVGDKSSEEGLEEGGADKAGTSDRAETSPIETTVAIHAQQEFMDRPSAEDSDNVPETEHTESDQIHSVTDNAGNEEIKKLQKQDSNVSEAMPAFGNLVMDVKESDSTSNISLPGERKEHLYKILVIGELGTGKTSIIKRYVHQFFSQHYRATIGVDFALKVLNWDANTIIRLQLWDIAGQERFGNMTRVYYKDAVGAFIVFDVTRVATFDAVDKWKQDLDSKVQLPGGSSIPCVLLGNKCDQQKEGIVNTPSRMDEYCKEKGFSGWFETSAKENVNIEEAARFLVNKILLNDSLLHSSDLNKDADRIAIDDKGVNGFNLKSSKTCSC